MFDTVIIGAGIAGATAAIYASRKRMNYAFITDRYGGQFIESFEVLNYPGIKKASGPEFAQTITDQLEFNDVKLEEGVTAEKIEKNGDNFIVKTNKGDYETRTAIIATGARARRLDVEGEQKFNKKGVTYCAICDGPLFAGKDVVVVGGGNSALEAVDFMKDIANKIYIINIIDKFTGHEYLVENVKKIEKVEIIMPAKIVEIYGDKFVDGIKYEKDGSVNDLKVQGIIVEIGRVPNTEFVKGFVDIDKHDHISIDCTTAASVPGIFAAGDCSSVHEFQYVIAAGQGCTALLKAARYLAGKKQ